MAGLTDAEAWRRRLTPAQIDLLQEWLMKRWLQDHALTRLRNEARLRERAQSAVSSGPPTHPPLSGDMCRHIRSVSEGYRGIPRSERVFRRSA